MVTPQIVTGCDCLIATVATAAPRYLAALIDARAVDYREAFEALAGKVYCFWQAHLSMRLVSRSISKSASGSAVRAAAMKAASSEPSAIVQSGYWSQRGSHGPGVAAFASARSSAILSGVISSSLSPARVAWRPYPCIARSNTTAGLRETVRHGCAFRGWDSRRPRI